jgi:transposase-like protein
MPDPRLADRGWLDRRYTREGASIADLAEDLGCARETVRKALIRHGIPRRLRAGPIRFPQLADRDWLARRYLDDRDGVNRIAAEVGCTPPTVHRALQRHDIPLRSSGGLLADPDDAARLDDPNWLQARYHNDRMSLSEIADSLGVSRETVTRRMAAYGIAVTAVTASVRPDRAWLAEQYTTHGRSTADIAEQLGVAGATVSGWLRDAGIPARPRGGRVADPDRARLLDDPDWLAARLAEGMTSSSIGRLVSVSTRTVRRRILRHGLDEPQHPRRGT